MISSVRSALSAARALLSSPLKLIMLFVSCLVLSLYYHHLLPLEPKLTKREVAAAGLRAEAAERRARNAEKEAGRRVEVAERKAKDTERSGRAVVEELARVRREAVEAAAKAKLEIKRAKKKTATAAGSAKEEGSGEARSRVSRSPSYGRADGALEAAKEAARWLTADANAWHRVSLGAAFRGAAKERAKAETRATRGRRDSDRETTTEIPCHRVRPLLIPCTCFFMKRPWVLAHQAQTRRNIPRFAKGKTFMDRCVAGCPAQKALDRRGVTAEQWRRSNIASIKVCEQAGVSFRFTASRLVCLFLSLASCGERGKNLTSFSTYIGSTLSTSFRTH